MSFARVSVRAPLLQNIAEVTIPFLGREGRSELAVHWVKDNHGARCTIPVRSATALKIPGGVRVSNNLFDQANELVLSTEDAGVLVTMVVPGVSCSNKVTVQFVEIRRLPKCPRDFVDRVGAVANRLRQRGKYCEL